VRHAGVAVNSHRIGLAIAAPVGPIGVLVTQRTLHREVRGPDAADGTW